MRLINALWCSFYSGPLYRDVFTKWRGIGLMYLCLLSLIQTIVSTAYLDGQLDLFIRDYTPSIVQQIPKITIRDGKASTPDEKPYSIVDGQTGARIALIDTSLEQPPAEPGLTSFFVGKKSLYVFNKAGKVQTIDFPVSEEIVLDQALFVSLLKFISSWGALLLSPFSLAGNLVMMAVTAIFFSFFAWINFKSAAVTAPYTALLRLTAVALSPAVLFSMITVAFIPASTVSGFLFVLLAVGYIAFAVHAVKKSADEVSGQGTEE